MMRVLVPIAILKGETVPPGLVGLLRTVAVTILGYHVVPEQTPPDQARLQFEERANEALDDLCDEFEEEGGQADHRLVFTHDKEQTIDRVAAEIDASVRVLPGVTGDVDQLLVTLSGDVAVDRILTFVMELVDGRDIEVTVFLASADEAAGRRRLDEAADRLGHAGIDVRTEFAKSRFPFRALLDMIAGHDAIVMGEMAPSLQSLILGDHAETLAREAVAPVLVVRALERSNEQHTPRE